MPSLEQIIRPFVVDPTTPPVPVITTLNKPPPEPVRLNIGIGGTRLHDLGPKVAPILPPPPLPPGAPPAGSLTPKVTMKTLSSSHSLAATWYMTGVVREQSSQEPDPYAPTHFL